MANLAPRPQNEDFLTTLVKQDIKSVQCQCLLLVVIFCCWLPHAVVSCLNSQCRCLDQTYVTVTSWNFLLVHAMNPIIYGLMNSQFFSVLKQWLLTERVHAFKMRDTLILRSLERQQNLSEETGNGSPGERDKYDLIIEGDFPPESANV